MNASESVIGIDLVAYLKFKANLQVLNILLSLYAPVPYYMRRHQYGITTSVILTCGYECIVRETVGVREAWPGCLRVYLCVINIKKNVLNTLNILQSLCVSRRCITHWKFCTVEHTGLNL